MRYIDLFGGIGGFRLGINQATAGKWECVWYCDIDKYAVRVYDKNFGEEWKPTDVRVATDIPEHDLICAGFPCQSFSIAGRRKGFADTRGTLFYEIARIAQDCGTPYLLLENVKGLLSHDRGRTFATILSALDEMGYRIQWEVLNSKNYGVPQNRERVFIVASLRDRPAPQIFPLGEGRQATSRMEQAPKEGMNAVMMHNIYGGFGETEPRVFRDCSPTIRTSAGGGHIPAVVALTEARTEESKEIRRKHRGKDWCPRRGKELKPRMDGLGNCLTATTTKEHLVGEMGTITEAVGTRQGSSGEFLRSVDIIAREIGQVRRLTPIECERLQGFPDDWTLCPGMSDTQRYKQVGNAVTVNVVRAIVEKWVDVRHRV